MRDEKIFREMYDSYILGIPYNGKIVTWEDLELLHSLSKQRCTN